MIPTWLLIFGAQFAAVYLLGLQSLITNNGHKKTAMVNSLAIGVFQLYTLRVVPAGLDGPQMIAFLISGPLAIYAAMTTFGTIRVWLSARTAA